MKHIKQILVGLVVALGLATPLLVPAHVSAVDVMGDACKNNGDAAVCKAQKGDDAIKMTKTLINTMLYVLGIVAVVMIVISGIKYTMANGDPSMVKNAKDTLMYSVIGLIVAILAFSIVNFVLTNVK